VLLMVVYLENDFSLARKIPFTGISVESGLEQKVLAWSALSPWSASQK